MKITHTSNRLLQSTGTRQPTDQITDFVEQNSINQWIMVRLILWLLVAFLHTMTPAGNIMTKNAPDSPKGLTLHLKEAYYISSRNHGKIRVHFTSIVIHSTSKRKV